MRFICAVRAEQNFVRSYAARHCGSLGRHTLEIANMQNMNIDERFETFLAETTHWEPTLLKILMWHFLVTCKFIWL